MIKQYLDPINNNGQFGTPEGALELQNFFQDLKQYATTGSISNGSLDSLSMSLIYDQIQGAIAGDPTMENFTRGLFRKEYDREHGIEPFERELSHTIKAVLDTASLETLNLDDIFVGQQTANIGNINTDKLSEKVLQHLTDLSQKKVEQGLRKTAHDYVNIVAKAGKIDAKGSSITINTNVSPQLQRIASLLSEATFSAKNYKDTYIQGHFKMEFQRNVDLGKTNPYKAYYGILSSLGYDSKTISKTFSQAYWYWAKDRKYKNDVANYITQIRQVYELTGIGLIYNNTNNFGAVKYIIYNAPNGGIYVKSTGEIISEFLNGQQAQQLRNPFTSGISISKRSLGSDKQDT